MSFVVEFPGLGWTFDINRVAFTFFGISVYWYGIFIGLGMVLAVLFAFSQCDRFGIDGDRLVDVVVGGLLCGLIGGRLYYILFSNLPITDFFRFRSGGIAIYGGIIGGFLGAALLCKLRKVPMLPLFDLAGMGFLIGQCLGRWGNFFNQEAFGTNTTLPWGMYSSGTQNYLSMQKATLAAQNIIVDPTMPVHPTFLYESLWCALGFLLLFLYKNHRKFNGEIFLFYVMWYGVGRAMIEGLRTDSLMIEGLGIRVSQLVAIVSVLVAFAIWVMAKVKTHGKPLQVPAIPPHKAVVKLDSGESVTISWPANGHAPNKEERLEMAKVVQKAGQEKTDEKPDKSEEKEEKPDLKSDIDQAEKESDKKSAEKKVDKADEISEETEQKESK